MKKGKAFLNDSPYEHGSVSWYVTQGEWKYDDHVRAEVRLSDCSKHINLEFGMDRYKDVDYRLSKIDLLIKELQDFREALADTAKNTKFKK